MFPRFYDHCCKLIVFCGKLLSKTSVFLFIIFSGGAGKRGDHFEALNTSTSLKRKIIETFHEKMLLYPNEYLIVYSGDVNPCQFIVAILRDKALKVFSARTLWCHHRYYCTMHCTNDRSHI